MGPFADETIRGCEALAEGRCACRRSRLRGGAIGARPRLAAEIGWIEAVVLQGRAEEALSVCRDALGAGDPTVPLLVACGEAQFSRGRRGRRACPLSASARPRRGSAGLWTRRTEELRLAARDQLLERARGERGEEGMDEEPCRHRAGDRAGAGIFRSARRGRGHRAEAGEKAAALRRYREAMEIEPRDTAVLEKTGEPRARAGGPGAGDLGLRSAGSQRLAVRAARRRRETRFPRGQLAAGRARGRAGLQPDAGAGGAARLVDGPRGAGGERRSGRHRERRRFPPGQPIR